MRAAFFVSSVGDTDLAKATIEKLIQESSDPIFIIPLTGTAASRITDMPMHDLICRVSINQITDSPESTSLNKLPQPDLEKVLRFITENDIKHIYVGVPSIDNHIPFQIAQATNVACTIAYEYMFNPVKHVFWDYIDDLADKPNCNFAVPLIAAKDKIENMNPKAKVELVGHLSIDRSQQTSTINPMYNRSTLLVAEENDYGFISGTTLPANEDNTFLNALLNELSTGHYPNLQLRMGIHPGVNNPDDYLKALLKTCEKYPNLHKQFKIILTTQLETKLQESPENSFILRCNISGSDAAHAADKISQAVPGALLNEAALNGKPCYYHEKSAAPYLPGKLFSDSIATFFNAKRKQAIPIAELGLSSTAPEMMAAIMMKVI